MANQALKNRQAIFPEITPSEKYNILMETNNYLLIEKELH